MVGVLLLAGLIFAGGTLAVFFGPRGPAPTDGGIAFLPDATPSRLDIFEQQTATPVPTPEVTPWFPSPTPLFTDLLSPTPVVEFTLPPSSPGAVTPGPTRTPKPTKTPTATPDSTPTPELPPAPVAKFKLGDPNDKTVPINNNTTGEVNTWHWNFGDGEESNQENPGPHTYSTYGEKTVTLTVSGPGGSSTATRSVTLTQPTEPPTASPSDSPTTDPQCTSNPPECTPAPAI